MHIYYILHVKACGLIIQLAKKLISLLAISPARRVKARSKNRIYYLHDDESDKIFPCMNQTA